MLLLKGKCKKESLSHWVLITHQLLLHHPIFLDPPMYLYIELKPFFLIDVSVEILKPALTIIIDFLGLNEGHMSETCFPGAPASDIQ